MKFPKPKHLRSGIASCLSPLFPERNYWMSILLWVVQGYIYMQNLFQEQQIALLIIRANSMGFVARHR